MTGKNRGLRMKMFLGRTGIILFIASTLFLTNFTSSAALASAASVEEGRQPAKSRPLSPEERQHRQARVKEVKELLKEVREGKRDDKEKYVLLRHLLMNYGILGMEAEDPEVRSAKQEWDGLLRKHPEFKSNPPREIKEQRELRERTEEHARDVKEKVRSFVPKLDKRGAIYWSGEYLAVIGQTQIDFYRLPSDVECHIEYGGGWIPLRSRLVNGKSRNQGGVHEARFQRANEVISLKPFKTISFGRTIDRSSRIGGCDAPPRDHCTVFAIAATGESYAPEIKSHQDWEMVQEAHRQGRRRTWSNPKANFPDEFYGVFSIQGMLLGQIPFSARPPDSVLQPLYAYQNGTAIFAIGRMVVDEQDPDGPSLRFGAVNELFVWSKSDGVQVISLEAGLTKYC